MVEELVRNIDVEGEGDGTASCVELFSDVGMATVGWWAKASASFRSASRRSRSASRSLFLSESELVSVSLFSLCSRCFFFWRPVFLGAPLTTVVVPVSTHSSSGVSGLPISNRICAFFLLDA